jgi:hypothetical protein
MQQDLVDSDSIPPSVLQIDGALKQLTGHQKSDFASEILQIAAGFQSKASDSRLGLPRTQNTSLQKASNARFKNLAPSKAKTILTEMKERKDQAGRVKITVGLYMMTSKKKGGAETMKKVRVTEL